MKVISTIYIIIMTFLCVSSEPIIIAKPVPIVSSQMPSNTHYKLIATPVRINTNHNDNTNNMLANTVRFAQQQQQQQLSSRNDNNNNSKDEDNGDWITNKNGTLKYGKILNILIVIAIIACLLFIFRKYVRTMVGWIETACHGLFISIVAPIRVCVRIIQTFFYPIKQCIHDTYTKINHYYHPWMVVS